MSYPKSTKDETKNLCLRRDNRCVLPRCLGHGRVLVPGVVVVAGLPSPAIAVAVFMVVVFTIGGPVATGRVSTAVVRIILLCHERDKRKYNWMNKIYERSASQAYTGHVSLPAAMAHCGYTLEVLESLCFSLQEIGKKKKSTSVITPSEDGPLQSEHTHISRILPLHGSLSTNRCVKH